MSWLTNYKDVDYTRWLESGFETGQWLREETPEQEIEASPSESLEQTPIQDYEKVYDFNIDSTNDTSYGFSERGRGRTMTDLTPAKSTTTGDSIYQGLIKRGLSSLAAAGVTGNLFAESAFDTSAINPSSKALGLAQWLGSRKRDFKKFANETGRQINDLNLQLDFIVKELQTTHKHVAQKLDKAKTPTEASDIVMKHFEIPSPKEQSQSRNKRIKNTLAYYKGENGVKIDSNWLNNFL